MPEVQRLDWIILVTLLGAVQGVFLAAALLSSRRNRVANRLLAAMMLAFSVGLTTQVYHALHLERDYPHFFGAGYPMPLLYGPLVYLYSRFAADRSRVFTRRDALHLVPFGLVVGATMPVYAMSGAEKMEFFARLQAGSVPAWIAMVDWLKFISGAIYTGATIVFLRKHRRLVEDSYSSTERVNLRWLLRLGLAAAAIWSLAIAFQLAQAAGLATDLAGDRYVSLAVSIMVYAIGYRALRQPEIFRYETAEHPVMLQAAAASPAPAEADDGTGVPRYERSGLGERQAERLRSSLLLAMDREQPWRNSDLTLASLAEQLGTTPHKLSEVLNVEIGESFYDFVNGYRVRDVQRRLDAGEAQRHKLLTLAMDAGFASKSTFNLVFKKHTNQTPSGYLARSAT